jgi:hypothetical protein
MDGDDLLISTQAGRAKANALQRDPSVTVCVLAERHPSPRYLTIYGRAKVESAGAVDLMMRIGGAISGTTVPEAARPPIEERARNEDRVVLRITPEGFAP